MRNPKPKRMLTHEQEKQIEAAERLHVRAEIFTLGVAELLKRGEYCGIDALGESARVLQDAAQMRNEGYRLKSEATKDLEPHNPIGRGRRSIASQTFGSDEP